MRDDDNLLSTKLLAISSCYFNSYDNLLANNVFHYTNGSNLPFILKDGEFSFRMTLSNDFEDISEGKIIFSRYNDVLIDMLCQGYIDKVLYERIKDVTPLAFWIDNDESHFISKNHMYVLCFTKQRNSTYMWNNYCSLYKEGVNIIIPTYLFHSEYMTIDDYPPSTKKPFYNFEIKKIVYLESEQYQITYNRIKELIDCFKESGTTSADDFDLLKYYISETLRHLQLVFKESKYQPEDEIRVLFNITTNDEESFKCVRTDNKGRRFVNLKIKNNFNGYKIQKSPYFESNLDLSSYKTIDFSDVDYDY